MAKIQLTLHCLAVPLDDGQVWLHAAGFPELNAIGSGPRSAGRALHKRIEDLLRVQPSLHAHRRVWPAATLQHWMIEFKAPGRSAEWRRPVQLQVAVLCAQAAAQWMACVPAIGLHVLAGSEAELKTAVLQQAHTRLIKYERVRLRELAQIERYRDARLIVEAPLVDLPSAKARAARSSSSDASVLGSVADAFDSCPAHGLDAMVLRLHEALSGEAAHSVLLVGPAGCGKTTAVAELARRHPGLGLLQTTGARLIAGQSGYGQWQQRLRDLVREMATGKHILHLGALSELMEVGRCRAGEQSLAGFLRGDIARGTLRVIAECTPEQLAAIERDEPGLIAAFQTVSMDAPDAAATRAILHADARRMALPLSDETVDWIERLHRRYAGYSARPARALAFLRDLASSDPAPTPATVTRSFAQQTGLPLWLLDEEQPFDRSAATQFFSSRVLGQARAVQALLARIAEIKADLHRSGRPLGSFLLIGPTGTGKTELAKSLARFLFGSADRLTRFDLSQATDPQSVQRLIGASVLGAAEGLLTARIREQPFSVLLLDEFEKAHPSFFDLLLQMLGDGRLTDGSGRVADFSNAVVLLTSNLGASDAQRGAIGFTDSAAGDAYEIAVKRFVRPELYNRFDAILPFAALDTSQCRAIAAREAAQAMARDGLKLRGIEPVLPERLIERLASQGFDAALGARALKRCVERELVVPVAELLAADPSIQDLRWTDAGPAAARQPRDPATLTAQAEAARELRRSCHRLRLSPESMQLSDEASVLALQVKRMTRRKLKPSVETVGRLNLLQGLQADLDALLAQACAHEDEVLVALWKGETTYAHSVDPLALRLQHLRRRVLSALHRDPDHIEFLVVADVHAWLREILTALGKQPVQLEAVQVIERHGSAIKPRPIKELGYRASVLTEPPPMVIGCTLIARGELCRPLFAPEFGVHMWRPAHDAGAPRFALLRGQLALADIDPAGWRGLAESALPRVREFDHVKGEVREGKSRRAWDTQPPHIVMAQRMQARLQAAIERIGAAEPAP